MNRLFHVTQPKAVFTRYTTKSVPGLRPYEMALLATVFRPIIATELTVLSIEMLCNINICVSQTLQTKLLKKFDYNTVENNAVQACTATLRLLQLVS